jgi:hypothetical protein
VQFSIQTEKCINVTQDNRYKSIFRQKHSTVGKSKNTNNNDSEMTCHGDAKIAPSSSEIRGA